jgi:hypothetical protein
MLKTLNVSILIVLMVSVCANALERIVPFAVSPPTIDGILSPGEWSTALHVPIAYPDITTPPNNGGFSGTAPTDAPDLSADCYLMWDNNRLYFAAKVYDDTVVWSALLDPNNLQDAVQLGFNPRNETGNWNGSRAATIFSFVAQTNDSAGPQYYSRNHNTSYSQSGVVNMSGSLTSDGYIIEGSINWEQVGGAPAFGDTKGATIILSDADSNPDTNKTYLADSSNIINGANSIDNMDYWNKLRFIAANGCGTSALAASDINKDCVTNFTDFVSLAETWVLCTSPVDTNCARAN